MLTHSIITQPAKGIIEIPPLPSNTFALQDWHLIPMLHVKNGRHRTEHVSCLDIGGYFKRGLHHVVSVKFRLGSSIHTLAEQMHRLDPGRIDVSIAVLT
jgi:hypothetical protein